MTKHVSFYVGQLGREAHRLWTVEAARLGFYAATGVTAAKKGGSFLALTLALKAKEVVIAKMTLEQQARAAQFLRRMVNESMSGELTDSLRCLLAALEMNLPDAP